jgi:hypothetical protein
VLAWIHLLWFFSPSLEIMLIFRNPLVECFWPWPNILSTSQNDILKLNIQIIDKPINVFFFLHGLLLKSLSFTMFCMCSKNWKKSQGVLMKFGLLTRLHVNLCHFYLQNSMATLFLSYHNIFIGGQVKCTFGHGSQIWWS